MLGIYVISILQWHNCYGTPSTSHVIYFGQQSMTNCKPV